VATPMSDDEMRTFLDRERPAMLGVLGTLRRDGSPHVVPVWYRYDGEAVYVWTTEERAWVRHILGDDRVSFTVPEPEPPYSSVVMHGRADVTTSDGPEVLDEIRRITRRYIEEPEVESYIAGWTHLRTIVTIRPERVTAWGRGY
jgi:PPOX class probable F420-dependent enzyme